MTLVLSLFSLPFFSLEISIDGKLDESIWNDADEYSKYYESLPFTLNEPKDYQKVLILEDENGIYLGFVNEQAKETVRANKHERDDEMSLADKNGVSIDFDADGLIAYQFFVSSGGSIGDATYTNEKEKSTDWKKL